MAVSRIATTLGCVVLLAEDVDRNGDALENFIRHRLSSSSRRTWIEI